MKSLAAYTAANAPGHKPCLFWFAFLNQLKHRNRLFPYPRFKKTVYPVKKNLTDVANS